MPLPLVTRSTIFASNADTNYNVFLVPTGTVRWYRSVAGGNAVLSTWDDTGCDANSQVLTSGTHGLTALGTSNNDDFDFSISTSSSARNAGVAVPGGQIDYRGYLRVATHDAGSWDADATGGPTEPTTGNDGTASGLLSSSLTAAGTVGIGATASHMGGLRATDFGSVQIGGTSSAIGRATGTAVGQVPVGGTATQAWRTSATAVATAAIGGTASALARLQAAGGGALEIKAEASPVFRMPGLTALGTAGMPGTLSGLMGTQLTAGGQVGIGCALQALAGQLEVGAASLGITGGGAGLLASQAVAVGIASAASIGTATSRMGGILVASGIVNDPPREIRWWDRRPRRRPPPRFDAFWQD